MGRGSKRGVPVLVNSPHVRRVALLGCAISLAMVLQPTRAGQARGDSASPAPVREMCPDVPAGMAQCFALSLVPGGGTAVPAASTPSPVPVGGFTPAQLVGAYGLPTGGSEGSGRTIALVEAYDTPTAESDLAAYRTQYGLAACTTANGCFRRVNELGVAGNYPTGDSDTKAGWQYETALDIEMASAICPNCKILLVEANSEVMADLLQAEATAVSLGADAISNSYGSEEFPAEVAADTYFNHPGIVVTAATGDCGYKCKGSAEYPAASPYVVAVGGTTLAQDSSSRGWSESAWGGSGSGCSVYEPRPSWQFNAGCPGRMVADISAVANPSTGVAVVSGGGWSIAGGTSVASPIVAASFMLGGGVGASDYPAAYLYATRAGIDDVVNGSNNVFNNCTVAVLCTGMVGFDGPTGLGSIYGTTSLVAPSASTYYPLSSPVRLVDSRNGTGLNGRSSSEVSRWFTVTGGAIPDDATAVTGNLTVTDQTSQGWLYVGPDPAAVPGSSTLNFPTGDVRANNVTVKLETGNVSGVNRGVLFVDFVAPRLGPTAQVVFDVTGYFAADTSGATYHPLDPTRILDTRNGTGFGGQVVSGTPRALQVKGTGVIPDNAIAVTGNLTVTNQGSKGWLAIGPDSSSVPSSSNLNFPTGDNRANGVTAKLDPNGKLWVAYVVPGGTYATDVIFDLTGYYTADTTGAAYFSVSPNRILDTRVPIGLSGRFITKVHRAFTVVGGSIPATATAVTGNLTATGQSSQGWLYVGPQMVDLPGSSTLNFPYGDNRANGVTVGLNGTQLSATFVAPRAGNSTQVIFDVTGYFAPLAP